MQSMHRIYIYDYQVYVAASAVFGLEAELGDLEECARSISGETKEEELSHLEEQVASAAAHVQQSELQVRYSSVLYSCTLLLLEHLMRLANSSGESTSCSCNSIVSEKVSTDYNYDDDYYYDVVVAVVMTTRISALMKRKYYHTLF